MVTKNRAVALLRGSTGIAICMAVMNVATYLFTILAARFLGPGDYGVFAALLNTLLVVSVVSLGLQATAARRLSVTPPTASAEDILRVSARVALVLTLLLAGTSPLLVRALQLPDLLLALTLAVTAFPLTVMGGQAGILQGRQRWGALGAVYLSAGVPRLLIGLVLIIWQPSPQTAFAAVAVGAWAPVLVAWWALRSHGDASSGGRVGAPLATWPVLRECAHSVHLLLAFFVLSSADIVLARNTLSDHEAGLYAAGLILTKAMLFLPQFVVVIAFPRMSSAPDQRRALAYAMALIGAAGLVGIGAAWWLRPIAVTFVGGEEFAEVRDLLWLFALLGALLALLQLLVYGVLAREDRSSPWIVWLAVAALIGAGLQTTTPSGLVVTALIVTSSAFALLLSRSLWQLRRPNSRRSVGGLVPAASGADGHVERHGE